MSAGDRKEALERLAALHGTSPADNTTAGEDLADALENPAALAAWCAVTEREDITYLYPNCETVEAAKDRALQYMGDPTFHEMPVEVVNLDSGEAFAAELGVVSWHPTADSAEVRAVRLLQARGTDWQVGLADTGGGVVVCAVERTNDEAAPYAWVTGSETEPAAFLVCTYTRERWEEPISSKEVSAGELPRYLFAELARVAEKKEGAK